MLAAGADAVDHTQIIVALITVFGGIVMALIAAWSAVMVARATHTQQTTVATLEARVKELEEGTSEST